MGSLTSILPGGFDAAAVDPQENRSYEPLPRGTYDVEITNAEVKETSSGNGTGLKVEYTVIGPTHAGRKVFQFVNIRHTSAQAEQIGQSQLSALCRAVDIPKLTDSDQLFQKMLRVSLKIRPAANGYEASNDVTGYEAVGASAPASSAPQRAAAPAAGKATPWAKARA